MEIAVSLLYLIIIYSILITILYHSESTIYLNNFHAQYLLSNFIYFLFDFLILLLSTFMLIVGVVQIVAVVGYQILSILFDHSLLDLLAFILILIVLLNLFSNVSSYQLLHSHYRDVIFLILSILLATF